MRVSVLALCIFMMVATSGQALSVVKTSNGVDVKREPVPITKYESIVDYNIFLKVRPKRGGERSLTGTEVVVKKQISLKPYLYLKGIALESERPYVFMYDTKAGRFIRLHVGEKFVDCELREATLSEAVFVNGDEVARVKIGEALMFENVLSMQVSDGGEEKPKEVAKESEETTPKKSNSLLEMLKKRRQQQMK
ncbi:hypothetical protein [Poriferisphaera sp. WC338]|uniref:hypothetical protein n=1 Tax=Poriferisphaera sp. WC338 TaxID=3425129 RepID=UPI003D8136F3